jgi:tetratricopeptide (TPR) repeat protein
MDLKKLYLLIGLAVVIVIVVIMLIPSGAEKKDAGAMPSGHPDVGAMGGGVQPTKDNVRQDIMQKIADLRKKVQSQPYEDTTGVLELAEMISIHKPDEAIGLFERFLKKDPKNIDAMTELTVCYFNNGKMDEAEKVTEKIVSINPKYTPAYYNLGAIQAAKGNKDKAKQIWEKLIKDYPESPDAKRAKEALTQL